MATETTNFKLKKPDRTDFVNVTEQINDNLDILDVEIKEAQDKADQAFQSASNGKAALKTAITGVDPTVSIPTDATFQQLATAIGQIKNGVDTTDATATAEGILAGLTAYIKEARVTGTMVNNGPASAETVTLTTEGAEYTIPKGFHSGLCKIKATITNIAASVIKAGVSVGGIVGTFTADATATPAQMLSGAKAYVNGNPITGTIPVVAAPLTGETAYEYQATDRTVGKWSGDGLNYVYLKIPKNTYLKDTELIRYPEENLISDNIKSGKSILGVSGKSSVVDTADAIVTAADIISGNTVYANGNKITGTLPNRGTTVITPGTAMQAIPYGYHNGSGYVPGDANLIPGNILSPASIFGVAGTAIAGKRFASGIVSSSTTTAQFVPDTGSGTGNYFYFYIPNLGLSFTPKFIMFISRDSTGWGYTFLFYRDGFRGRANTNPIFPCFRMADNYIWRQYNNDLNYVYASNSSGGSYDFYAWE